MMAELDLQGFFGRRSRITRSHLKAAHQAVASVQPSLQDAGEQGLLPHLLIPDPAMIDAIASDWRGRPLVILGEPSAAAGAAALAAAQSPGQVLLLDSPDPVLVTAALAQPEAVLVILDGPAWVRWMARALASQFSLAVTFVGDGTEQVAWAPDGVSLFSMPGSADPRFSGLCGAGLAMLSAAGGDVFACCEAIASTARRCFQEGLAENPGAMLAAVADASAQQASLQGPHWSLPSARLGIYGRWLCGAWTAMACHITQHGELKRPRGVAAAWSVVGDEPWMQVHSEGMIERWTIALRDQRPDLDLRLGEQMTAWRLSQEMARAEHQALQRSGQGQVTMRVARLDGPGLCEVATIWLHAAALVGGLRGDDPLTMDAADRWRVVLEEDILPEGDWQTG
ncbi:MAG: hypothetical protein AAFV53_32975 [Myxococcota bacterium]